MGVPVIVFQVREIEVFIGGEIVIVAIGCLGVFDLRLVQPVLKPEDTCLGAIFVKLEER